MKKIFSLVLALSLVMALFAGFPVFADGEEIAVAGDGSAVTLDLEKATLETYNGSITVKREKTWVKTSADATPVEAYFLKNAQSGDCATWNVNFAKAGNYKIEVPVYSQTGVGVISAYIGGERVYSAGNFAAGGYGKEQLYNNNAVLYVSIEKAGKVDLTIFFETLGANILAPKISFFAGQIPAEPAFNKYVSAIETDGFTNNATKALLLGEDTYYGLHVNFAKAIKGIALPQWTPGAGAGHCKFKLSVYTWNEDDVTTLKGTPVTSKEFTTPGDCIMLCMFDEAVPAGEYFIYVECVELILDEGSKHSSGIDMHMKTGLPHSFDDFVYYFDAYTNIPNYVPVPDRMVYFNFIVDEFVAPEDFFLELGSNTDAGATADPDATVDPNATEEPDATEKPEKTEAPATSTSKNTKAPSTSTAKADADTGASATASYIGIIIGIVAGVVVVAAVVVVVIIVIKKKK
ncbi:MAG: hypothetical protein IKY41_02770 [Clostridia bacterium]|nr:hypothetical protein [Clostridia bacterium]